MISEGIPQFFFFGCSSCSTGLNRKKKMRVYLRKSGLQWLLNRFQPKKKNWGIPSEIMVAVVAQTVSTILGSLPNYTFGNQGCSGCSTGFNHSWISPKLYLRKSGLQWLLNRFQPKKNLGYTFGNQGCSGCSTGFNQKKIGVYLQKSGLQWLLNQLQPFLELSQTIPSEIRVAVVAQPVSTEKKNLGIPLEIMVAVVAQPVSTILGSFPNYTFGNQGCSGCSTGFNRKKKNWGIPS